MSLSPEGDVLIVIIQSADDVSRWSGCRYRHPVTMMMATLNESRRYRKRVLYVEMPPAEAAL